MNNRFTGKLHLLCEQAKWTEALTYVQTQTSQAREEAQRREGMNLWTPLTIACVRADVGFLKELIELAPEAVLIADRSGSLPLHFVACWRRSRDCPDVLHLLINANERTLYATNQWGQTPLHSAFDSRDVPSSKIVRILIQPFSSSSSSSSSPSSSPSASTLEREQAVMMKDRRGRLPLHIACEKGAQYTVIRLLIGAWSDAGRVPLRITNPNSNATHTVLAVHLYAQFLSNTLEQQHHSSNKLKARNPQSPPSLQDGNTSMDRRESNLSTNSNSNGHRNPNPASSTGSNNNSIIGAGPSAGGEPPSTTLQYTPISAMTTAIIELLLRPILNHAECAKLADAAGYTALHLAAKYNVRYEVLKKVLRTYPDAASLAVPLWRTSDSTRVSGVGHHQQHQHVQHEEVYVYPLDLLEQHRPEVELWHSRNEPPVESVSAIGTTGANGLLSSQQEEQQKDALLEYNRKSDLLFAYDPMIPTGPGTLLQYHKNLTIKSSSRSSGNLPLPLTWRYENTRLQRLEYRIISECQSTTTSLSETCRVIWLHWCSTAEECLYSNDSTVTIESKKGGTRSMNYLASIGRVISTLNADGLWKLTFVKHRKTGKSNKTSGSGGGTFIKIIAADNRTVFLEAERRACNGTFTNTFLHHNNNNYSDDTTTTSNKKNKSKSVGENQQQQQQSTLAHHQHLNMRLLSVLCSYLTLSETCNLRAVCSKLRMHSVTLLHPGLHLRADTTVSGSNWVEKVGGFGVDMNDIPLSIPLVHLTHSVHIRTHYRHHNATTSASSSSVAVESSSSNSTTKLVVLDHDGIVAARGVEHCTFRPLPNRIYHLRTYNNRASTTSAQAGYILRQYVYAREYSTGRTPLHYLFRQHQHTANDNLQLTLPMLAPLLPYADVPDCHGRYPLHDAVQCGTTTTVTSDTNSKKNGGVGVGMEVLVTLIRRYPAALTAQEYTRTKRTPLHLALSSGTLSLDQYANSNHHNTSSSTHMVSQQDTIKSLLWITPGEHACSLKDGDGNLPLHLACSMYASMDCSSANTIDDSNTTNGNGMGVSMLKELLETYPDAAYRVNANGELPLHLLSQCPHGYVSKDRRAAVALLCDAIRYSPGILQCTPSTEPTLIEYPIHIACAYSVPYSTLESMLHHTPLHIVRTTQYEEDAGGYRTLYEILCHTHQVLQKSQHEMVEDATLKEDLVLSYNPHVCQGIPRRDPTRLQRMVSRIREEVPSQSLSTTALNFWQLFCTHQTNTKDDDHDHYIPQLHAITSGLDTYHLQYLASIATSSSNAVLNAHAKDILQKCFLFVARYELEDATVEHLSAQSCVLSGWDYSAVDVVGNIRLLLRQQQQQQSGTSNGTTDTRDLAQEILHLCRTLQIPSTKASTYLENFLQHPSGTTNNDNMDLNSRGTIGEEMLSRILTDYNLDPNGARPIVLKFYQSRTPFDRDVSIRKHLQSLQSTAIVPILATYCAYGTTAEDALYKQHIRQRYMTSLYRYPYAMVLPRAEKNLDVIWREERLSGGAVRDVLSTIGSQLLSLHEMGIVHCDVVPSNLLRMVPGNAMLLTDFDAACWLRRNNVSTNANANANHASSSNGNSTMMMQYYYPGYQSSGGVCPPEMIDRLDLDQTRQYNRYWRHVSDDAKDLKLLTPDDVTAISDQVRVLMEDAPVLGGGNSSAPDDHRFIHSHQDMMDDGVSRSMSQSMNTYENGWQESISSALAIMSFDDLPRSLAECRSVEEFSTVWDRILSNAELWEKIRPRIGKDGNIYVIKTYHAGVDGDENLYSLPYDLLPPSEKIDIWAFGCLMFQLCSGGPLFKVNRSMDLGDEPSSYATLSHWDNDRAEHCIKRVSDPLAQDLLMKLLVREDDRLASMKAVLRHPFFGSTSNLEALKILEKHEEQQLLLEETTTIPLLTSTTLEKFEHSTEKHSKIVFETGDVVAPTCLMALPYQLKWDIRSERLVAPTFDQGQEKARQIGQYLLEINAATARLSFWLAMKKNFVDNCDNFQQKLAHWLQRGSISHITLQEKRAVAKEVIEAIGYSEQYLSICMEMLQVVEDEHHQGSTGYNSSSGAGRGQSRWDEFEEDEEVPPYENQFASASYDETSNSRSQASVVAGGTRFNTHKFIKDPMGVAKDAIRTITNRMQELYSQNNVFLYLMDEYHGTPVLARPKDDVYPILIHSSLLGTFLPFMNISCMAKLALNGIEGLANLIGLSYENIPQEWESDNMPLIHHYKYSTSTGTSNNTSVNPTNEDEATGYSMERMAQSCSSVAEFAVLQDVLEKLDPTPTPSNLSSAHSTSSGTTQQSYSSNSSSSSRLRQLESFFRERDQSRTFSGLQRLCDGKGPAIWTTQQVVQLMQDQALQASLESRLKHLKEEWLKREKLQVEIAFLSEQLRMLCPSSKIAADAVHSLHRSTNNLAATSKLPLTDEQMNEDSNGGAEDKSDDYHAGPKKQGKRRRGSWAELLPTTRRRSKPDIGRRQSWSAFDCPKLDCEQDAGKENDKGAQRRATKDDTNIDLNEKKKNPKRRQSFTEFLMMRKQRSPSVEEVTPNKQQQSSRPTNKNKKKRQSWSAFAFGNRRSWTNGKPLNYLDDDEAEENAMIIKPQIAANRERLPSVDSIFRRPSNVEPPGLNRGNSPNNTQSAQRRSINAAMIAAEGITTVDRRPSAAKMNKNISGSASNNDTAQKRTSWADKLKNTFQRENNNSSTSDENKQGRRRSSAKATAGKRGSGRGSWRNMFGGGEKPRPAPLIDDPDPDEDDGGEYFLAKRGKRNSNSGSLNNESGNVMRLDYDGEMVQRMQEMNMMQDPMSEPRNISSDSTHSFQKHRNIFSNSNHSSSKQNLGYSEWDMTDDAKRNLGFRQQRRNDNGNGNGNANSNKLGLKKFFSRNSKPTEQAPNSQVSNKSKGKPTFRLPKINVRRSQSVPKQRPPSKNSQSDFPVRKNISKSLSYEDNDGGYHVVM